MDAISTEVISMAKDYTIPERTYAAIEWHTIALGGLDNALQHCRKSCWKLDKVLAHEVHGRCGGNAGEELAKLRKRTKPWDRDFPFGAMLDFAIPIP